MNKRSKDTPSLGRESLCMPKGVGPTCVHPSFQEIYLPFCFHNLRHSLLIKIQIQFLNQARDWLKMERRSKRSLKFCRLGEGGIKLGEGDKD